MTNFSGYGYLTQIPTDVQYSIFLNAPSDTLDDLCQNSPFFDWCQNDRALLAYVTRLDHTLLEDANGFIRAVLEYRSALLSKFLTDQWLNQISPIPEPDSFDTDHRQLSIGLPRFVNEDFVNFVQNADFGFEIDAVNHRIPLNALLTIITQYQICTRSIISRLMFIYFVKNGLYHSGYLFPDQFFNYNFPGFTERILTREQSKSYYQNKVALNPLFQGGIHYIPFTYSLSKEIYVDAPTLNDQQRSFLQIHDYYLTTHLFALNYYLCQIVDILRDQVEELSDTFPKRS